ncbi:MAG: NADH-ubiquinone oxidoreductase chain D, partial [uncultured Rubrobacteraceae bacterium]
AQRRTPHRGSNSRQPVQRASREPGHQGRVRPGDAGHEHGAAAPRHARPPEAHTGARRGDGGALRPRDGLPAPEQGEDLREQDVSCGRPDHGPHRLHEQHRHGVRVLPGGGEASGRGDNAAGRRHPGADERVRARDEPYPVGGLPHAGARGVHPDPVRLPGARAHTVHLRGRHRREDDVPLHPHRGREGRPPRGDAREDVGVHRGARAALRQRLREPYRGERDLRRPYARRRQDNAGEGGRDGPDRCPAQVHRGRVRRAQALPLRLVQEPRLRRRYRRCRGCRGVVPVQDRGGQAEHPHDQADSREPPGGRGHGGYGTAPPAEGGRRYRPGRVRARGVRRPRGLRRHGYAVPGPLQDAVHREHAASAGDRAGTLSAGHHADHGPHRPGLRGVGQV